MLNQKKVFKSVLSNGLTVLIYPKKSAPQVAMQMWYNVGSKHEQPGEKGMAHFLEHMIFKGTNDKLSESDINMVTQKLAAYANAFTSYDYTAYVFDVPVMNWTQLLPIFADCMQNCSFLQDHMNSEVKAVIQELKMYRDEYGWTLADSLVTNLFESHPYHYPIIGYKQDLWSLKRETFLKFYKKYYVPNNAALVIVGDVDPAEAMAKVEAEFKSIPRGSDVKHEQFFCDEEMQSKHIKLHRETQQAFCMLAFLVPGAREKKDFIYDIIGSLLVNGKGSRLYKKLVNELELVISIHAMTYDLFDKSIFFIEFKPKHEKDIAQIKGIILEDIHQLSYFKIPETQMRRALKIAQVDYQHLLEDTHKQAYAIGKSFTAMQDENYPFNYCVYDENTIADEVQSMLKQYFRSSLCNSGSVLNVLPEDKDYVAQLQEKSDELDSKILQGKERVSDVAEGKYVHQVQVKKLTHVPHATPETYTLSTGLKVMLYRNTEIDLVECSLKYKADHKHDPKNQLGISNLVAKMMVEGTENYPGSLFVQEVESFGISLSACAGQITASMLSVDASKGLELVADMLQNAEFNQSVLVRIKSKIQAQLVQYWDTPQSSITQVAQEHVYGDHPYAQLSLGTEKTIAQISREACLDFYHNMITPQQAVLVVVGNFDMDAIKIVIDRCFASWTGQIIPDVVYPALRDVKKQIINIEKQRDQIVMAFAGLSVARLHPAYDALLVFDQLLTTGMNSYLFSLREQSGLFYTISGSTVYNAGQEPGMIYIKTIVSKDRLQEAQDAIASCLDSAVDKVTDQEFDEAKEMVINKFSTLFETYENTVNTFLFLDRYNLPYDYFENRIAAIRAMKKEDMQNIVRQYLNSNKLTCIRIGRI